MNVKEYLLGIVATYPGIKATELVTKVAGELYNDSNSSSDGRADVLESVPEVLESLVKDGSLVEVEYVVPSMSYRVKSMYFPKDTGVQVRDVLFPTKLFPDEKIVWHHEHETIDFRPVSRSHRSTDLPPVPKQVILHSDGKVAAFGPEGDFFYETLEDLMLDKRIGPNILLGYEWSEGMSAKDKLRKLTEEFLTRCAPPKGYVPDVPHWTIEYGWKDTGAEGYRACVWVNDFIRFGSATFSTPHIAVEKAREISRDMAKGLTSYTMRARA